MVVGSSLASRRHRWIVRPRLSRQCPQYPSLRSTSSSSSKSLSAPSSSLTSATLFSHISLSGAAPAHWRVCSSSSNPLLRISYMPPTLAEWRACSLASPVLPMTGRWAVQSSTGWRTAAELASRARSPNLKKHAMEYASSGWLSIQAGRLRWSLARVMALVDW